MKEVAQCLIPFMCVAIQKSLRWDSFRRLSSRVFVETLPSCSLILLTTCQHRSTTHFTNTMGNIAQHELSETVEVSMLYGIRTEYWETFLLVNMRQLRHLMHECSIFGDSDVAGNIPVQTSTEKPLQKVESKAETPSPLRDFCEDRQPWSHSTPVERKSVKNNGVDQQRLQISELHFDKLLTPRTFSCWKKNQLRQQCNGSKKWRWLIQWTIWNLRVPFTRKLISRFRVARREDCICPQQNHPEFILLEEQKEDRFLRGRQIAYLIYDYFRVTGAHDTVLDYADFFTVALRNNDIQELDTWWDEILSSMTKLPQDDILESLYKLRIQSDQLQTVLELYNLEIHEEKANLIITDWR